MRDAFAETISRALDTDPRLALVLADISADRIQQAARRHPDRVINVGIREQLLIGVTGGLALAGMRPVAHTFPPFLVERAFEQIKLDLSHQDAGAVLVSWGGSYDIADNGRTHMAPGDVALMDTLPGWRIQVPGHPREAAELVSAALPGEDSVYLRLSAQSNAQARPVTPTLQVVRRGREAVVVAVGPTLDRVLAATASMDVTVLYASTVRPFDGAGLRAAVEFTGRADVVLVEPYLAGTSTHCVAEALLHVPHRVLALGVRRDVELRAYGEPADHDAAHGLDVTGIAAAVHTFTG
ncbi:transketolase [Kutzneria viridogrisea]|uniref:Transketolase n=1 Tax=Kutzneria viridogrisea TaxID=47990 RepID=A0ABR6BFP3_9PSEU|nr:transketolase [Kutzneria viridogrisea]